MKLIDLTQLWCNLTPTWPYFPSSEVVNFHSHHKNNVMSLIVKTNMHSGTHVDAPLHFNPAGKDMAEVPLEQLYGTGLILDLSDQVEEYTIVTKEMILKAMPKGEELRQNDILILHFGWQKYSWVGEEEDETKYFCKCPGPGEDVTEWLIEKNIKWAGCDAPSFEHPLNTAIREYRPDLVAEFEERMGKPIEELLPIKSMLHCHRRMMAKNLLHVDNIGGDIAKVLNRRVTIGAFPWRFHRGEASICRLVVFDDSDE